MSDLYAPQYNRKKFGNFDKHKGFVSVVGGTDAYFLEDEYNEMQWMQNEARADILRLQYYSGVIDKGQKNDIIVVDTDSFKENLFSFQNMSVLVNGYILDIKGNLGHLSANQVFQDMNINNVILPAPPTSGEREDFVYLEVWFKEVNYQSDVWYGGNTDNFNGIIKNDLMDLRINGETCRRVQLQWAIRSAAGIDFSVNPNGFNNTLINGNILAKGGNTSFNQQGYSFWRSDLNLDGGTNCFKDKGLWIAGKGVPGEMATINGYVYAIPLFRVSRRNSSGYAVNNYNGAVLYNPTKFTASDRPDSKFANRIYADDITDLRNIITIGSTDYKAILQNNFQKLLTGQLKTKNAKIIKEYFGVDEITPTSKTKLYVNCNQNMDNAGTHPNVTGICHYVPSVEQEGVIIDNGYFAYNIDSTIDTGYVSMFVKLMDSDNKNLWALKDNSNTSVLCCHIIDGQIFIMDKDGFLGSVGIDSTPLKINEFCHIALTWSVEEGAMSVLVNGKVQSTLDVTNRLKSRPLKTFVLGYCELTPFYCTNTIIDQIEYSTVYTTSFTNLPIDFVEGNAKLCIDMQKGRRLYTNTTSKSIMTSRLSYKAANDGSINFSVNSPIGSIFSNTTSPKLYFDNEALTVGVAWSGLGTNVLTGKILGLGPGVTYNFVLIYEVEFDENQGLNHLPEKVYKIVGEEITDPFLAVRMDKKYEAYSIDKISSEPARKVGNQLDSVCAYKSNVSTKMGFGCAVKYYVVGNSSDKLIIPKTVYGQTITTIFDINVVGSLEKRNLIKSYTCTDSKNINIQLTTTIDSSETLEVILGTMLPNAVYNHITGGIENLLHVEEVKFIGDGRTQTFIKSFNTRVLNSLASYYNGNLQFIAYVDSVPTIIDVELRDTFALFKFPVAPKNKSMIVIYVNSEYEPVRSERFQIWYETTIYQGIENKTYIQSLDECNIVYHLSSIFSITEGLNLPLGDSLNKNYVSSVNLPIDANDTQLVPTLIVNNATNIRSCIDYAVANDNDFNDSIPLLNKLKINISNKKINRGYTGYVTVDDKSLYSNFILPRPIPHLNILPLLVKDNDDKLMMVTITTYSEGTDVSINGEYNYSAIDVFNLDENILLK